MGANDQFAMQKSLVNRCLSWVIRDEVEPTASPDMSAVPAKAAVGRQNIACRDVPSSDSCTAAKKPPYSITSLAETCKPVVCQSDSLVRNVEAWSARINSNVRPAAALHAPMTKYLVARDNPLTFGTLVALLVLEGSVTWERFDATRKRDVPLNAT
jgi:hypothetical protein